MTQDLGIARRFDAAAGQYDQAALIQNQIARHLVQLVTEKVQPPPHTVLDIGCGTGFVAASIAHHWPKAEVTGVDSSVSMLQQAKRKIPHMRAVAGDVAQMEFPPDFDLIVSSMALHWLPDSQAAIRRWRTWLRPGGRLFIAVLTASSFEEWRKLCAVENLPDGLWPLPPDDFARDFAESVHRESIAAPCADARDFLHRIKIMGGATPRPGHKPLGAAAMRRLLSRAPKPFTATYRILYFDLTA